MEFRSAYIAARPLGAALHLGGVERFIGSLCDPLRRRDYLLKSENIRSEEFRKVFYGIFKETNVTNKYLIFFGCWSILKLMKYMLHNFIFKEYKSLHHCSCISKFASNIYIYIRCGKPNWKSNFPYTRPSNQLAGTKCALLLLGAHMVRTRAHKSIHMAAAISPQGNGHHIYLDECAVCVCVCGRNQLKTRSVNEVNFLNTPARNVGKRIKIGIWGLVRKLFIYGFYLNKSYLTPNVNQLNMSYYLFLLIIPRLTLFQDCKANTLTYDHHQRKHRNTTWHPMEPCLSRRRA